VPGRLAERGDQAAGRRPTLNADPTTPSAEPASVLASVFRDEAGRLTAALVRVLGDFEVAE
jgi:hypothetical protein